MRKYTKPVMEMERIEMNQAIAACQYYIAGWISSDNMGGELNIGDLFPTEEEALNAAHDREGSATGEVVFPVIYVEGSINHGTWVDHAKGYLVDKDRDGRKSPGEYYQNQTGNPDVLFDSPKGVIAS